MIDYKDLLPHCYTDRQREVIDALTEHGSIRKAAAALGTCYSTVQDAVGRVRRNAARQGIAPEHDMTKSVPAGFHVKGVSTYYDEDGNVRGQWVRSQADAEADRKVVEEALIDRFKRVKPLPRIAAPRKKLLKDLMNVIVLSDAHIGLYSWAKASGTEWSLPIARRMIVGAVKYLVDAAPPCEEALIANLGDFFHIDNKSNQTTAGTVMDTDGLWEEIVEVGIDAMVSCIDFALAKHKKVRVINKSGNHDFHTAVMMNIALSRAYKNNPRVKFDATPSLYSYLRFGKTLLGITHGDKRVKPTELPLLMATDRPDDWGESKYRYWYTGHLHHQRKFEPTGGNCTIETFRIMAGRDAWHQGAGYRAGREMQSIILHREFGETGRNVVTPDMLMT